jgi:hypothetical protein
MSARMWAGALHHVEMVGGEGGLTLLQLAVSSSAQLALGRSPYVTFRVEVTDELVAKFRRLEGLCSWHEGASQVDALWPLVSLASDSLALLIPSLVARDSPDGVGE